jgi:hypothetical protein
VSTILTCDPGTEGCALGIYVADQLIAATLCALPGGLRDLRMLRDHALAFCGHCPDTIVVEQMWARHEAGAKGKSQTEKILVLQAIGGYVAGMYSSARPVFVPPHVWKGNVPKEIHHMRVRKALNERELAILIELEKRYGKKAHNVRDAIGLGLFQTGRLRP